MRTYIVAALSLLVLGLAACAGSGATAQRQSTPPRLVPASTPEQHAAAFLDYRRCLVASAARSDDHMSDASTIARSMRGSCYPEVLALARATTGGLSMDNYYAECERLIRNEFEAELQAVLDERRLTAGKRS